MILKEKFTIWLNTNPSETLRDIQCEIIAEDFAIVFAEWCIKWRVEFIDDTREGMLYTYGGMYQKYTMNEILEIYKKQQ